VPRRPHRRRSRPTTIVLAVVVTLVLTAFGLARVTHVPVAERLVDAGGHIVRQAPAVVTDTAANLGSSNDQGSDASDDDESGYIATGASISVFAEHPAVTRLDPALRTAIRRAAIAARGDGITLRLNSGWRSADYQQRLLDEAIARYGSERTAREYVNTPERSTHVQGARGRHRPDRRRQLAQPARHRLRALPDLRQRDLALRAGDRARRQLPRPARRRERRLGVTPGA